MTDFAPTDEQLAAVAAFETGRSLAIEAGAGTGKTSTLVLLGRAAGSRRGAYVAFNKAIVNDAGAKMPRNVKCSTAHSLAFRAVGRRYAHRLDQGRVTSQTIADLLGLRPITVTYGKEAKALSPAYLAGHVMRAVGRFCQTGDREPGAEHFPYVDGIDMPVADGKRGHDNNRAVAARLLPALVAAWADLMDRDGRLPYRHDHYLKAWQLSGPVISADFILFDEAQDANPVMVAIVAAQRTVQLVWVGDSQQSIYEWNGAVNALASVPADARTFLTRSFRFGPAIADVANGILERIDGAELRLIGHPDIASTVAPVVDPDALLCRTNATAVRSLLLEQAAGRQPALVGGAAEVLAFARAAGDLKADGFTAHPELACFTSWGQVQTYVEQDAQGDELRLLVELVDEFGVEQIVAGLERQPAEADADLVISTAHKAKGREWPTVRLAGDFPSPDDRDVGPEEWRLLYVACTRARRELDVTACPHALRDPAAAAQDGRTGPAVPDAGAAPAEPWSAGWGAFIPAR